MTKEKKIIKSIAFGITILLCGCTKDLYDDLQNNSKKSYTITKVPLRELAIDQKFDKAYQKISQKSLINEISYLSKTTIENTYGFTIVDKPANVMDYNGKTSYSLEIEMDNTLNNELKNLLIEVDNQNTSKQFIVTYKLDESSNNQLNVNQPIILEEIAFDPNLSVSSALRGICIITTTIHCIAAGTELACAGTNREAGCYTSTYTQCSGGVGGETPNYGNGNMMSSPVGTAHQIGTGGVTRKTPCNKLKDALDPTKGNIKPDVLDLFQTIPNAQGENGVVYNNSISGNISPDTASQNNSTTAAGNYTIPLSTGGNVFMAIHTHPLDAYPMFTASDVIYLNTLNNNLATHNIDSAVFFLATIDDNGQNQLYAIMFNNDSSAFLQQNTIDDLLNTPEYNGCTPESIGVEIDKELADRYDKQYNLGGIPNYERSFLHQMFGYNVSLYKANNSLTNFSRLKVNSLTGNVATTRCN